MIDSNEWKVKIYENPATGNFDFYIFSNWGDIRSYLSDPKKGTYKTIKEEDPVEPSMTLTKSVMDALFRSLEGQGIKPVEQSFVEGKLESTEKHLEDIRTLVFKKKV